MKNLVFIIMFGASGIFAFGQRTQLGVQSNGGNISSSSSSSGSSSSYSFGSGNSGSSNNSYRGNRPSDNSSSNNGGSGNGGYSYGNNNSSSSNSSSSNNNSSYNSGYYSGYNNNNSNYYNNNTYNNNNYSSNNYSNTNSNQSSYKPNDLDSYGSKASVDKPNTQTFTDYSGKMASNSGQLYNNRNAINKFFQYNQTITQTFTVNAQKQSKIEGRSGTTIDIQPNSFVDKNGQIVQGDVDVELKEIYGKSDMILSNAHTVSNDMILESGGEMFINATKNGEEITLANDKPMSVGMPTNNPTDGMELFYGTTDGNNVNWNRAERNDNDNSTNTNNGTPIAVSNNQGASAYNYNINSLGWINCDKFRRGSFNSTKINVNLPARFDSSNTAVFVVFNRQNSVTRVDNYQVDQVNAISNFNTKWYSVPVGSDVTIVTISNINGEYYSSFNPAVIRTNHVQNISTTELTTMDEFKRKLEQLQ